MTLSIQCLDFKLNIEWTLYMVSEQILCPRYHTFSHGIQYSRDST